MSKFIVYANDEISDFDVDTYEFNTIEEANEMIEEYTERGGFSLIKIEVIN